MTDKSPPYAGTGTVYDYNEPDVDQEHKETIYKMEQMDLPAAHERRDDLDPRVHGPFLDEIRYEEAQVRLEVSNERREEANRKEKRTERA